MRRKRAAVITFILLAGFLGVIVLSLRAQRQQYALDRALIAALDQDDTLQARDLVEAGADPNTRYDRPRVPELPELVVSWLRNLTPSVDQSPTALLIACGGPGNQTEPTFDIPTHSALEVLERNRKDLLLLQAMLAHGAKANEQDKFQRTPLMWATCFNRPDEVRLLAEHGADVNTPDKNGRTPLMVAAGDHVSPEIVRLLLDHGANVNQQDVQGKTALAWAMWDAVDARAATGVGEDIVEQLLAQGANPNIADKEERTPLKIAQDFGRPDLVILLKRYGAKQ